MKKLNKKGFTLVELLAVIVVLAIIMVLTLPTIMNSMNSARQSTFLLYASRMLDTAADKYQSDALLNGGESCYTIEQLNNGNTSKYHGIVRIEDNGNVMKVQMYDDNYQIGFQAKMDGDTRLLVETDASGNINGEKSGGVTYKDIEVVKSKVSSDNPLQTAPKTTGEKEKKVDKKNADGSCVTVEGGSACVQVKLYPTACSDIQ